VGGGGGGAVLIRAIRFGTDKSLGISILETGRQMNCWSDFGFEDVAMMACFDNSVPLGFEKIPTFVTGLTSGRGLRKSYQMIFRA